MRLPLVDIFISFVIDWVHIEVNEEAEMIFESADSNLNGWEHPPSRFSDDHLCTNGAELVPQFAAEELEFNTACRALACGAFTHQSSDGEGSSVDTQPVGIHRQTHGVVSAQ